MEQPSCMSVHDVPKDPYLTFAKNPVLWQIQKKAASMPMHESKMLEADKYLIMKEDESFEALDNCLTEEDLKKLKEGTLYAENGVLERDHFRQLHDYILDENQNVQLF